MYNTETRSSVFKNYLHALANVSLGLGGLFATGEMLYHSSISSENHRAAVIGKEQEDIKTMKMEIGDKEQALAITWAITSVTCLGGALFSEACRQYRKNI